MRSGAFRVLVLLTVCACLGCSGEPGYLELSWEEFDQDPQRGWRPVAERGEYADAALMIEAYLERHDDLPPGQIGFSRFHAGQLWALEGDTAAALAHMDRAEVTDAPPDFPQTFNSLVSGTRSFLRGDMSSVCAARDNAAAMPDPTDRDRVFVEALRLIAECEGLSYREVYERALAEGR